MTKDKVKLGDFDNLLKFHSKNDLFFFMDDYVTFE